MTNAFSRSWEITKVSFGVIKKDKEMLLFPILSGIFSLIFLAIMLFPTILIYAGIDSGQLNALNLLMIFIAYFGVAFIATFFNVATVFTAKTRFEGENATFMDSIKFAFSKLYVIFLWSLVSATVGLILRMLENAAKNQKGAGKIVGHLLVGALGLAWSIVTIFVTPILVYKGLTPFKAIKESTQIIKKTWGESLIRHFGLGLIQGIVTFVTILLIILLVFLTQGISPYLTVGLIILGIVAFVLISLVFGVANSVFNTALYIYATEGKIPGDFSGEELGGAFKDNNQNNFNSGFNNSNNSNI